MSTDAGGLFISFEGSDGVGKSTQVTRLAERIRDHDRKVVVTREPGGTSGAEEIRRLLLEGDTERWSAMTELLLFCAARRDHLEKVIEPALAEGAVVLCDRFHDSTAVYQAAAGGVDIAIAKQFHQIAVGRVPALTLVLLLSPQAAEMRCQKRSGERHRFEEFGEAFRMRVEQGYRQLAEREPERCREIDASGNIDKVAQTIWETVAPQLRKVPPSHG